MNMFNIRFYLRYDKSSIYNLTVQECDASKAQYYSFSLAQKIYPFGVTAFASNIVHGYAFMVVKYLLIHSYSGCAL